MGDRGRTGRTSLWRPIALLSVVLAAFVAMLVLDVGEQFAALEDWIRGFGLWGPVIFGVLFAIAVVLAVPGMVLTIAAGALFGTLVGTVTVSIASTVGAVLAFLVGRFLARDAVAAWVEDRARFRRYDRLSATHGVALVLLLRIVPIFPYNLINYALGLTRVGLWNYTWATAVGMLPWTVLYVVLGDAGKRAVEGSLPPGTIAALALLAVTVWVLGRMVRRRLRRVERQDRGRFPNP